MLPDMTQQLMIHKPRQPGTTLTPDGSRLAALSNKSWVFDELHTATAMFASPPEHGNGSTPIDHRLAFDAVSHSIVVSAPQIQHLITPTGQSRLDQGAIQVGGMNPRCATTGKIAAGYFGHRGQFERAPSCASDSHSLPGLPHTIHTST